MTLEHKLTGNILEVKQTFHTFTATRVSYWYTDIENWLTTDNGKKDEVPTRNMSPNAIAWAKKHHLPKVDITP